jgi:hypothetical protein
MRRAPGVIDRKSMPAQVSNGIEPVLHDEQ